MAEPLLIIGSYLSPCVHKVLVLPELKGIAYHIDPIVPFFDNEAFERLSPLRQILALVDGDFVLNDSSVICQYLEERYPQPSLYPAGISQYAQARWLEEYIDSRLGQVIIWQLFHQLVTNRSIWQREPDQAILQRTYDEDLPSICSYLEERVPSSGWLCGELSITDVAVACPFCNAQLARYQVDGERRPCLVRLLADAFALPALQHLVRLEEAATQTPVVKQRQALREAGVPPSAISHTREWPVHGPMSRWEGVRAAPRAPS